MPYKITPVQGGCLTAYATDDIVNSTTHIESVWSSNDTLSFKLAEPYFSDDCIDHFKWRFGSNQALNVTSQPEQPRITIISDASSVFVNNNPNVKIYYLVVEIYDKFDTTIGREAFQVYIDIVSPIIINSHIVDIPLFEEDDFDVRAYLDFEPNVSGIEDIVRITWSWTAVNFISRNDSFTILDPVLLGDDWIDHTFAAPAGIEGGDKLNIRVEIEDRAGNISFHESGFEIGSQDFIGDYVGRTEADYTVEIPVVYRFAIWNIPIEASDFNTKRCQNSTTYLVLRNECHVREAQIRFTPGTYDNCPNCNFPLVETTIDPIITYFDTNFPVNTPFRGDDDDGVAILRFELNERYFNLHEFWNLSLKTRREKLGRDFIDLITFSDVDVNNKDAVGHFEIRFSESELLLPIFHTEDSLSGISGFKYFPDSGGSNPFDDGSDPLTQWLYVQGGAVESGRIGYEPQVDFEPGKEYFYEWRFIKVFPNGDRSFGSFNDGSFTFSEFLPPTADPDGFGYTRFGDGLTGPDNPIESVDPPNFGMVLEAGQYPLDPNIPNPSWFNPKYIYLNISMLSKLNIGDNITLQNNDNRHSFGRIISKSSVNRDSIVGMPGTPGEMIIRFEIEKPTPVGFNDINSIVLLEVGLYREYIIDEGSFQGFYFSGLISGPNYDDEIDEFGGPINILSYNKEFQSSHYRFNFGFNFARIHVRIPKINNLTNRLIVKIRVNTDGVTISPSGRDGSFFTLGNEVLVEKDVWSVLTFDLEDQEINGTLFPSFDPTTGSTSIGIFVNNAQADITYIDVDYIALVNRRPERRYAYINIETINPACFNDNRVGNFTQDTTIVSNCIIGYRAVMEGGEGPYIDGPTGPIPPRPNNYESGKSRCFAESCPHYSPIPVLNTFVEYIYDPIASRSQDRIPVSAMENLSGLLVCPNDRLRENGEPECINNLLRIPIPSDKKICSRDEGYLNQSLNPDQFQYRCNKFSKAPQTSEYDTSGRKALGGVLVYDTGDVGDNYPAGTVALLGTKIPATKVEVTPPAGPGVSEYTYERKAPDPFFWDYNEDITKCDGTLRDSATTCGFTLVGFSVGQRCPICNTALLKFEDYGVEIKALICSNTRKVYQTLFDCSIYQHGVALDLNFTNCPECNTLTKLFNPGNPVVEKFTIEDNVDLDADDIANLLSGHLHTRATIGWNEETGQPSAGYVGGFGGNFTDGEYFAITQFRPTIGTQRDEEIWEARIQKSEDQEDLATTRETAIQDEVDQIRFDLTQESRRAGDPEALAVAVNKDLASGTLIDFNNQDDRSVYARYNGTSDVINSNNMYVQGDSPINETLDGERDDLANWGFRQTIKNYLRGNLLGKQKIRISIKDLEFINLSTLSAPYDPVNGYLLDGRSDNLGWMKKDFTTSTPSMVGKKVNSNFTVFQNLTGIDGGFPLLNDELFTTNLDYLILRSANSSNKFGSFYVNLKTQSSHNIFIDPLNPNVEYWNGSWTILSNIRYIDNTNGFSKSGLIRLNVPSDWTSSTINSSTGYWIRIRRTNTTNTQRPLELTIRLFEFEAIKIIKGPIQLASIYIGRDADAWAGAGKWNNPNDAVSSRESMIPSGFDQSVVYDSNPFNTDLEVGRMDKYNNDNEVYEIRFNLRTDKSGGVYSFYISVDVFKRFGHRAPYDTIPQINIGNIIESIEPSTSAFNEIIKYDVTNTFWDGMSPPTIQPLYSFNNINLIIEMEYIQGGSLKFRGFVNEVSTSPEHLFSSNNLYAGGQYINIAGSATSHIKLLIDSIKVFPEIDFSKSIIPDVYNNDSALSRFGKYKRSTQRQYDEFDLITAVRSADSDYALIYHPDRITETYYQIWIDPSSNFNSRNGQPMRVMQQDGWTCLAKNDPNEQGAFHGWQFNSDYCPKYKQTISNEDAIASSYLCTECNSILYESRIGREDLVFLTTPDVHNPHNTPIINRLLETSQMPGEAPEDYLMLDLDNDIQQDHEVECDNIQNKFFDVSSKRYEISSWNSYVRYAGKNDNSGDPFFFISDIDFATTEHIQNCAHPMIQHEHPLNHPCIMSWVSIGRRAIMASVKAGGFLGLIRQQDVGFNRGRYEYVIEQILDHSVLNNINPGNDFFKSEYSDIRFSHYIPRGLLYRSWWERGDNEANYPSGATSTIMTNLETRLGNKRVEIEFGLGHTPFGLPLQFEEFATAKYIIWNDAFRDAFEVPNLIFNVYDNPSTQEWTNPSTDPENIRIRPPTAQPTGTDITDYFPMRDPFDRWHFVSYNLYEKGAAVLANNGKTWNDINTIVIRIVTTVVRDTRESNLGESQNSSSLRPNHAGIIIGEFQQGWKGRKIIDIPGDAPIYKDVEQFGPKTWDQKYYWKAVPYTLKLNPAYVDWSKKVFPNIPKGHSLPGVRIYDNQNAIWKYGFAPKRYIKRFGTEKTIPDKEAQGIFTLSKNWTTIVDRQDQIILPDGILLQDLQEI
jgi:hypothetical protein